MASGRVGLRLQDLAADRLGLHQPAFAAAAIGVHQRFGERHERAVALSPDLVHRRVDRH